MKVLESKPWFRAPRYRLDCDCGYKGLWYRTDFIPTAQWNYHHDLITFNELMRQHQIARITGNE